MASRFFVPILLVFAMSFAGCSGSSEQRKAAHLAAGDAQLAKKDFAAAILEYRKAVAEDDRFGDARLKLGAAYRAIGDMKNAYDHLVRAADLMPESVAAQLEAGSMRLMAGEYDEARARAIAALEKEPKNVDALILMGNALAGLKDLDGAISHLEEALDADPKVSLAYANVGLYELAKGNAAAAEATFKRATTADPKSVAALLNLGNFYWASGRRAEAEQEFKKAAAVDPQSGSAARALAAYYLQSGRRAEAEPYLKRYAAVDNDGALVLADYYTADGRTAEAVGVLQPLASDSNHAVAAGVRLAAIDFQQNKRPQAYERVDGILGQHPDDQLALETKARFLLREQRFEEGIKLTDLVLKNNPNALTSRYLRAMAHESLQAYGQASTGYREILQRAPALLPAQLRLANLYLIEGNPRAALDLLGAAVKAHPESGYARFLHGRALLQVGDLPAAERELLLMAKVVPNSAEVKTWEGLLYQAKNDLSRARAAFERGRALDPESAIALAGLVSQDLKESKPDAARARLDAALASRPRDSRLLLMAGNAYMAMGEAGKAEKALQTVLDVDPANMEAFSKLGVLYHSQGRLEEAKAKYQELARRHERPVAANTFLGMIFELQNNPAEARTRYQRALELDPKAAVAANNLAWLYAERDENLDIALQLAQAAKAQLPNVAQVNDTLGWIYYKKGLTNLAVTFLEEAANQGAARADIHYRLGLAYVQKGDQERARTSFEQVVKLAPRSPDAEAARRALEGLKG